MQGTIIFIIRKRIPAFERQKQGAHSTQIFFLRFCTSSHPASRINWVGQIKHKHRLRIFFCKVIRNLLCPLSGQSKGVRIYAAVPTAANDMNMPEILEFRNSL